MTEEEVLEILRDVEEMEFSTIFYVGNFSIVLNQIHWPTTMSSLDQAEALEVIIYTRNLQIIPTSHPLFKYQEWAHKFTAHAWADLSLSEVIKVFQHCYRVSKLEAFQ